MGADLIVNTNKTYTLWAEGGGGGGGAPPPPPPPPPPPTAAEGLLFSLLKAATLYIVEVPLSVHIIWSILDYSYLLHTYKWSDHEAFACTARCKLAA